MADSRQDTAVFRPRETLENKTKKDKSGSFRSDGLEAARDTLH